jgi:hypothetical protein
MGCETGGHQYHILYVVSVTEHISRQSEFFHEDPNLPVLQ